MPSLRSVQRAFAASLAGPCDVGLARHVCGGGFTAAERVGIYRNSSRGVLAGALRLTFPAVERLVGSEFFVAAAGRFAEAHWPAAADLNEYGAEFADFIERFEPARTVAYLGDVARFEWALSVAAHADDAAPLAPSTLASLDPSCYAGLRFTPHPSMRLLSLRHPADHIADAVLAGHDAALREIDLADGAPVRLVVHRAPDGVQAERVDALEFELLALLCDGVEWSRIAEKAGSRGSGLLAGQLIKGRLARFRAPDVKGAPA